ENNSKLQCTVLEEAVNKYHYQVEDLKSELKKVNDNILLLQCQTNDLTQYNKRKDLILYGIPFKQNENTYDVVLELAASVELQLNKHDFYAIHRLPLSKRVGNSGNASASIKISSMNIRSLVPQKDAVSAYLSLIRPAVLCLTETWLDNTVADNDISFFEYHVPWRLDRNRHGGGCAIYVRTDFHSVRLVEFEEAMFEIHAIRLTLMNQQHVTILNIYRRRAVYRLCT
ncbi:unnamed protein product, partial [Didymodactylos carnosus]